MPEWDIPDYIRQQARAAGIPEQLALGVADYESNFDPKAIGKKEVDLGDGQKVRGIGLFQLLPQTAAKYNQDPAAPYDPVQNVSMGVHYLKDLWDQYDGYPDRPDRVLAAYGGVKTDPTYVPGAMARVLRWQQMAHPETTAQTSAPPPAPSSIRPVPSHEEPGFWATMGARAKAGFDPTSREGLRNWGGMLGGAAGAILAAPTVTVAGPVGPGIASVLGAGAGGAAVAAAQNLYDSVHGVYDRLSGPPPKPPAVPAAKATTAGGPPAPPPETEDEQPSIAGDIFGAGTSQMWNEMVGRIIGAPIVGGVNKLMAAGVTRNAINKLEATFKDLDLQRLARMTPVRPEQAGRAVENVIQGPGRDTLNDLGQAVTDAAEKGPDVDISSWVQRLHDLSDQVTPKIAPPQPAGALPAGAAGAITPATPGSAVPATLPPGHPLPAVLDWALQQLDAAAQAGQTTIPMIEAHKLKRALSDAANFPSPARTQVKQLTKAFFKTVRQSMSDPDYDAATRAYALTEKLFSKGVPPALHKQIIANPEALVQLLNPKNPTRLQRLYDTLQQAHAQGPAAQAQAEGAWDSLRGAWTNRRLIEGDVSKLGDRIANMDPAFRQRMFGDVRGQEIIGNLETIAQAFTKATEDKASLASSTLSASPRAGQVLRDLYHVATPVNIGWKAGPIMRMLDGPAGGDMVRWAASSPGKTQLLVYAMNSGAPQVAFANLFRVMRSDTGEDEDSITPVPSHVSTAGPPPAPPTTPGKSPGEVTLTITGKSRSQQQAAPSSR